MENLDRRELQRQGKHPAPCARWCEATAFEVELRRLRALLREALPYVQASAEASHLTDGFKRKPDNEIDSLAHRLRYETNMKPNA
jgi:hypothetical protein